MTNQHSTRAGSRQGALALIAALAVLGVALWPGTTATRLAAQTPARLLALAHDIPGDRQVLAVVDQGTGALTPVGAGLAGCCTTSVLDGALDAAGDTYYAIMTRSGESAPRVLAFDTASGAATASAPLTTTAAINYLAYDDASGQLLALALITSTLTAEVLRIDPATGATTALNGAIANCCSPVAFDAAYDAANRLLYVAVAYFDSATQPRLLTISGANGALLDDVPLDPAYTVNHLAYDAAAGTLWAVVYAALNDAERLAQLAPTTGAITARGDGAAGCCSLLVTDAALDAAAGVLVAPMLDTSNPEEDDIPRFYRYALADGALLGSPAVDPNYQLHYIAFEPASALQPTPTATALPTSGPSPTVTATPTTTVTPTVTPTPTVTGTLMPTRTPLPPKLFLPAIERPASQ